MTIKKWISEGLGIEILIDYDRCIGVGDCVDSCPTDVYKLENGKAVVFDVEECVECCACVDACPEGAIKHNSC